MIYFDNSATTPLCAEAEKELICCIEENWGNPSSLHALGLKAEMLLEETRSALSGVLQCRNDEIFFTSGGTQANNIAVIGAAKSRARLGKTVITTSIEHPSVSKCFDELEKQGFNVIRLSSDRYGMISLDELEKALSGDVILVSMMLVNNELGTVLPIKEAVRLTKSIAKNAVFHCDAVQAFGKLPVRVRDLGVDLLSVSGHKIHAPKGAGALYVKKGTKIDSPVFGGGQEKEIRSGTEPMPAIAGLKGALKALDTAGSYKKVSAIKERLVSLLGEIDGVVINSSPDSIPDIMNISLPGYPSEVILNAFSEKGIYVSAGSACAKGNKSPVLSAAGLEGRIIDSSLRLSFSRFNEESQADEFVEELKKAMKNIRVKP